MNQDIRKSKGRRVAAKHRGFTLVEIVVVLFVIALGLIGVLTLIVQNIQSQSYNKNNLIAYQLAQEGVELVRKVRDSNWRASLPYNTGLADGEYYIDYRDTAAHLNTGMSFLVLRTDSNGFYIHDTAGTDSGFSRKLIIQNISGSQAMRVTAQVTWRLRNQNYSYDLETMLYDWR